jgi:hypothetical protein
MRLPKARMAHIAKGNLCRASEVLNAIVFLNNLTEEHCDQESVMAWAITLLKRVVPEVKETRERKLSFILEQLELLQKDPKQRRYSSFLLSCAVMWQSQSPALYSKLISEEILSLPAVSHLKRLSSALSVDTGLSQGTMKYLKVRTSGMLPREKLVSIVIDEV